MQTSIKPFRIIILALVSLGLGFSSAVFAQVSTYDSMYFPTARAIEGTRKAPRMYEVLSVDFGAYAKTSPMYFDGIKQVYSRQTAFTFTTFSSTELEIDTSHLSEPVNLLRVHENVLAKLSKPKPRTDEYLVTNFDLQNADNFAYNLIEYGRSTE